MDALEAGLVMGAGMAAGAINTLVGSGTLITFPALLAVGYAPVTANVSNAIGLVPGSVAGAIGYRRELVGQRRRLLKLGVASFLGALAGAVLLLMLPAEAFRAIVPAFIVVALVLIVLQPRLNARLEARRERTAADPPPESETGGVGTWLGVLGTGVYGGYFGAAQGIMLVALLGTTLSDHLQRVNATKNVLAGLANAVSGLLFVFVADVAWTAVALIAVGSVAGGVLGARYGRRLPASTLRGVIVVVGTIALVLLVARG